MSIYDLLMLVVFSGAILFGLWKGLAWQIASLSAIFVSYFVALNFRGPLSTYISASEPWNRFAAMLILFLGTSLIIWMAYGYMAKTIERMKLKGFDTQAGALLGAVKGILLCMLITFFGVTLFGDRVRSAVIASRSGGYITAGINRLNAMVPQELHAFLDPYVRQYNDGLSSENPDFVENSEEKLENGLRTIRGRFQLPDTTFTSSQSGPIGSGPAPEPTGSPSLSEQLGNQLIDQIKSAGQEVLDQGYTAGKQLLDGNANR